MGRTLAREPPAALPSLPNRGRGGCLRGGHLGRRGEAAQLDPERLPLRDQRRHPLGTRAGRASSKRGFATEREAARDRELTLARIRDRGLYVSRLTFGQFFPDWLRARRPYLAAGTWADYEVHCKKGLVPHFGYGA
ncbi:MAG TPA: hypothetical protein VI122_15635 [Thermoleophilaceae bacterium]|mgnify:CR=1 FL=1